MTLDLKHNDTYVSMLTKWLYIQLDDEFTPMSVKHQLLSNMKGMAHMLCVMEISMYWNYYSWRQFAVVVHVVININKHYIYKNECNINKIYKC